MRALEELQLWNLAIEVMRYYLIAIFLVTLTAPVWIGLLSAVFALGLQLFMSAPWLMVFAFVLLMWFAR